MLEIVEEILQAEKKAEELVRSAKERASTLRGDAERDVQELLAKARADAKEISQNSLFEARAGLDRQFKDVLDQSNAITDTFPEDNRDAVEALIEEICRFIREPEYLRD